MVEGEGVKPNLPVKSINWSDIDAALQRNGIVDAQAY